MHEELTFIQQEQSPSENYNWKISLTDLIYQMKQDKLPLDSEDSLLQVMEIGGFDTSKSYNITKDYLHRPLHTNQIVEAPFVEGYADEEYLDKHNIKTVEYTILAEGDDDLREDLVKQCHNERNELLN